MNRALILATMVLCLCLPLSACGGSSGGTPSSGGGGGPDLSTGPSVADITWPPAGFITDQPVVRVRGTATDPDGVAAVVVNGAAATSVDDFAHWEVMVPLASGDAALVVDVEDALGDVTGDAAGALVAARHPYVSAYPRAMVWDVTSQHHVILDSESRALIALDPATGAGGEISGLQIGAGPDVSEGSDVILDPASPTHAYVADSMKNVVFRVDLSTGDRVVVTDAATGTGPALLRPVALAYDTVGAQLLVADSLLDGIVGVDPATGNRAMVSGPGLGTGPGLDEPRRMGMWQGKVVLTESTGKMLVAVDLSTGDRTMLSDLQDANQGPKLSTPWGLLIDDVTNTAYVGTFSGYVWEIDLTSGTRTLFSGPSVGAGPTLRYPVLLTHGPGANEMSVFDWELGAVLTIDRATGDRTQVYRPTRGTGATIERPQGLAVAADGQSLHLSGLFMQLQSMDVASGDRNPVIVTGAPFTSPVGMAVDGAGDRLYFRAAVAGEQVIYELDLPSGVNAVISSDSLGTGPTANLRGLDWDASVGRLAVARFTPGTVLVVDPAVGDRVELSGPNVGGGEPFFPTDLVVDPLTGITYVLSFNAYVHAVDPTTGDRTRLSGGAVGSGPIIQASNTSRIVLDAAAGRLLLVSHGQAFGVDLATGERTLLSDVTTGVGPVISTYGGDIALDATRDVLWIADSGPNAILAVDLASGDRVIVAR